MAMDVSYGKVNTELIRRWLHLPADEDGPFWAVNLMKYREKATYAGGEDRGLSGREADDAYAPLGPLAAVGATVALHGDVLEQASGEPIWDRIAIVRYPTRSAFFEMQQRGDFQRQHEHKSAGMEFTIVLACTPSTGFTPVRADGPLVLRVVPEGGHVSDGPKGSSPVAVLDVEGVIVGDDRRWAQVRVDVGELGVLTGASSAGTVALAVQPNRDRLVESIVG